MLRYEDLDPAQNPTGESLLSRAEKPFRVWIPSQKTLVLGASQDPDKELHLEHATKDGIPIYKRRSGGGAVLLSPGCICIGLRFSKRKEFSIQDYFQLGSGLVRKVADEALGIKLETRGISDLVQGERKVAGCAMYMPRDFVLYLVSVLIDPDFSEIEKYLAYPSKEPDYRLGRSHSDFLVGLNSLTPQKINRPELVMRITAEIHNEIGQYLDHEEAEPTFEMNP